VLVWIVCEFEFFGELPDLRRRTLEVQRQCSSGLSAKHDVLGDGHSLNQHEVLMDHPDAKRDRIMRRLDISHLSIDDELTAVGRVETVGDTHRRRLPRPILADYGVNSPRLYDNIDMVVREYITEAFCDLSEFKHDFSRG
jgi:hypothetical protein